MVRKARCGGVGEPTRSPWFERLQEGEAQQRKQTQRQTEVETGIGG
jgi:hypothetical protein